MGFPTIYIYDGPSGIQCELGDMAALEVKEGYLLSLNIEPQFRILTPSSAQDK